MLFPGKSRVLGLELNPQQLRLVEMEKHGQSVWVSRWGTLELEDGLIRESVVERPGALAGAIRQLLAQCSAKAGRVHLVIPNQQVLIRFFKLPKAKNKDLRSIISWKLANEVQLPFEDPAFDFMVPGGERVLPEDEEENPDDLFEVMSVAAPQKLVLQYAGAVAQAGLTGVSLEPKSLSALRMIRFCLGDEFVQKESFAALEVNKNSCDMIIYHGGFVRIARNLSIDSLHDHTWTGEGGAFSEIIYQLGKLMNFSQISLRQKGKFSHIILLGAEAEFPSLKSEIERGLNLPVLQLGMHSLLMNEDPAAYFSFSGCACAAGAALRILSARGYAPFTGRTGAAAISHFAGGVSV